MTSHTCDGTRYSTKIEVIPRTKHDAGAERFLPKRREDNTGAMPQYAWGPAGGKIPQLPETFGYIAPAYACMNDHQLAIGESTYVGRKEQISDKGLIYCETLTRLMLERAKTAREAIQIAGQLLAQYGWADMAEALTIADTQEVWLMEIVGPGKDAVGAVWAAQRVPDDHVSIFANGSRIGEIDLSKPDFFMASANVMKFAEENLDVLQNLEFSIVTVWRTHPEMTDYTAQRAYEAARQFYRAEQRGNPPEKRKLQNF
jgi:dipeptidase